MFSNQKSWIYALCLAAIGHSQTEVPSQAILLQIGFGGGFSQMNREFSGSNSDALNSLLSSKKLSGGGIALEYGIGYRINPKWDILINGNVVSVPIEADTADESSPKSIGQAMRLALTARYWFMPKLSAELSISPLYRLAWMSQKEGTLYGADGFGGAIIGQYQFAKNWSIAAGFETGSSSDNSTKNVFGSSLDYSGFNTFTTLRWTPCFNF